MVGKACFLLLAVVVCATPVPAAAATNESILRSLLGKIKHVIVLMEENRCVCNLSILHYSEQMSALLSLSTHEYGIEKRRPCMPTSPYMCSCAKGYRILNVLWSFFFLFFFPPLPKIMTDRLTTSLALQARNLGSTAWKGMNLTT